MEQQESNPNQDTGLQIMNSLLTKKAKETKELIKTELINGNANPTYVGVVLKKFAKIAKEVSEDKDLRDIIETDTKNYQEGTAKTFEVFGAKITIANGGFWNYATTEDPFLAKMKDIVAILKEQIKARETELQVKAKAWEARNKPTDGGIDFTVKPFTVTWDELPKLTWEDGAGEVETNPPIKMGKEQLRYSV